MKRMLNNHIGQEAVSQKNEKELQEKSGKRYQIRGKKKKNDPGTMRNSYRPFNKGSFY